MNPHYALVSARARHVCEYCRAPEIVFNFPFEVEHITPLARGGETTPDNLALSCRSCNIYKADAVSAFDALTQTEMRLFNPRRDEWRTHFAVAEETGEVQGLTEVGRATIARLRINNKPQVEARKQWIKLKLLNQD